uniref:reverse transcriptase family protein n=1 Tax=Escherichia coli TaxID=562 RepID=UPI00178C56A8
MANVVLSQKPPTFKMCVDYTDLNKACPMDPFPLPNIDQLVDETAGCELMSFLDAFRGYHQISMHEDDAEKTAFMTPEGIFCYLVMAFGLKNSGATYTRMVAKIFRAVLG